MKFQPSKKIQSLTEYAFAAVDKKVAALKEQGINPIDFGVGDPIDPTPEFIRNRLKEAVDELATSGYPSYIGSKKFREKIAEWSKRRFDVQLNPETEITSNIGAKEFVFNLPQAFINPGDVVLVPNPGYPPYSRGTLFAGGETYYLNLAPENNFKPVLNSIPKDILAKAKILWINYPNNPTAAVCDKKFMQKTAAFCHKHNIILVSDEAYSEIYYGEKPPSILEVTKEGVIAINSLSKRSNMTTYRVGWAAGDANLISVLKKLKTNIDSGTATFVQEAAITALSDEKHVEKARQTYKEKHGILMSAFKKAGLTPCPSQATLYVWQKGPDGMSSVEFAERLLDPKIAIVTTPGSWISVDAHNKNPSEGFVRFSLTPSIKDCALAAERIEKYLKL